MDHYYLGYVEFIHPERLIGRIRPLARVRKRPADDSWIVDRAYAPGELGGTDRVFWPKIPHDQDDLTGRYVRFRVEVNQKTRDSEREWHEFVVAEEGRNGTLRRVAKLGLPILPEERVSGPDRLLSSNTGLPREAIVYRTRMKVTWIDGPWRVAELGDPSRFCLQPKEDGHVVEHALGRLGPETFHLWKDDEGEHQAVLLVEPAKTGGRAIDLLPASGLAEWLIRVLKRDKALLSSLDRASEGWRSHLGELLAPAVDPIQRELDRARFARLEAALDAIAENEARLADLAELPRFKQIRDEAIGREVASRRDDIRSAAEAESRGYVGQQRQVRDQERARAEREKQALLRELDAVRAEVADAERLLAEARMKVERDESSIRAAADHLVEARGRIVRDFIAFHGLIEDTKGGDDGSANGHPPAASVVDTVPIPTRTGVMPEGTAIDDQVAFLGDRLVPTMAAWGAEATRLQAKRLHAALVSCQWVAVPCPSWGVAYAHAIGAYARYRIVTVEPTWLSFSDAWGGEVGDFWREAVERRDALHLLIFADADRALVQCWARPLLDIVSGLRRELPSGHTWPENLRLFSCPSPDEAALPVPDWVVAHWAGIKAASGGTRPDGPIVPGHVLFAAWSGWVMIPDPAASPSAGLGVAARSAANERSALARAFRQLEPDDDPEHAEGVAREIREVDARSVFTREVRG